MVGRTFIPVLVSVWLLPWQQPPQPPPAVGFVLSMAGTWELNRRALKQGEAVPQGARLHLAQAATFGKGESYWIDVVLLNNKAVSMRCITAEACRPGLLLPASLGAPSSVMSRLSDVFRLIFERPERYVGVLSRGAASDGGFADGVARLHDGGLTLSPFFEGLAASRYRLLFNHVTPTTTAPAAAPIVNLVWDQTPASAVVQTTIAPGLYRVTLSRPADAAFAAREAWILVAADDRYSAAKTAFDEAVTITREWDGRVPARDVAIFRHAYLTELAGRTR